MDESRVQRFSASAPEQRAAEHRRTGKSVCHNQRTCKDVPKMRSGRFVRRIQLDESGAMSGNGSRDKRRAGNEEVRPFKLPLNRG